MNPLVFAVLSINAALILYTIGVWGERFGKTLKPWHLAFFWGGLIFDTIGTTAMTGLAGSFSLNLHGVTGAIALVLMGAHALWATVTLIRGQKSALQNFHKLSLTVWVIWLIPFVLGAILNTGLIKV